MKLNYSKRDRSLLALGIALVVLADLVLLITAQGGGGLFVWNLLTWPLAVLGGVITGYAVANLVLTSDKRIPESGSLSWGSCSRSPVRTSFGSSRFRVPI